jgi:gliding motility-associated-like protein
MDENGCKDSLSKTIHISMPKADLSYIASGATSNSAGEYTCPPVFENFTDKSSSYGNITSWDWVFGDGKSSTFQSPDNTYVFPGTYTLSLNVSDQFGCNADTVLVDYLTILGPGGDLSWTSIGEECEHKYKFSATNLTYVDSIIWHLDDGDTTFNLIDFDHIYAVGNYNPIGTLIDKLGCEMKFPMNTIVAPTIILSANAGIDQTICGRIATMNAVSDPNGVGTWSLVSGSGIISDLNKKNTTITDLGIGENVFRWTIKNICETIFEDIKITVIDNPSTATVGVDQVICVNTSTISANTPTVGTGTWSLISGSGTIASPTSPTTTVSSLGVGINKFAWTISNMCGQSSATITIKVESTPTLPIVGADLKVCSSSTFLDGNLAIEGIGVWTFLSGSGTITDPHSPTSEVTGLQDGINKFVWTISNSCSTNSKTFIISKENSLTTASAGVDQIICQNNATLSANTPVIGSGSWSLISGTGILSDPLNPLSSITGLSIGDNVFEWTITSFCSSNSDRITIIVEDQPTIANAGVNNSVCSSNSTLNGNKPLIGIGSWTLISGSGSVTDIHSENSAVTNLGIGDNIFKWTIVNSCSSSSSQVIITRGILPTIASAGKDSIFCESTMKLRGNKALIGIGHWTVIEGTGQITNPSDSLSDITGMGIGKNTFRWTISNFCEPTNNFDEVTYTIEVSSTISDAGTDQNPICLTTTNLAGNVPLSGIGTWTLESGSGIITSPNSPNSAVTDLGLGINIFRWTILNTCNSNYDVVKITRLDPPTISKVGPIKPICIKNSTLTGNVPIVGNGVWSLISGSGIITSITNPTSTVTNLGVGKNIFRWTIINSCSSSFADVDIIVETSPTIATVGKNQEVCGTTANLEGNKPLIGFGTWSLVSGSGKINVVSDTTTGISNLGVGENIYKWTISNSCNSSSSQITIFNTGECPDEDSIKNELIYYIPNSFTPNSDDFNQTFQPVFTSGNEPQKYTFYIFDRWGEIIFESHDATFGWKGTLGNDDRKAQDGVYTWKIKFTDINTQKEHTIVGHVVLIR